MSVGLGTNIELKRAVDGTNAAGNGHRLSEATLRRLHHLYGTTRNEQYNEIAS
jgi:hypothetical protein